MNRASESSSCAAAVAAHRLGLVDRQVKVNMPGGSLEIEISESDHIFMTGPVEGVFEGSFHPDFRDKIKL